MRIIAAIDVVAHVLGREPAVVAAQGPDRRTGMEGNAATLVQIGMGKLVADDLVTGLRVQLDGNLVGHRAARAEEPRFHPKQGSCLVLQGVDVLVFTVHVVADARSHHRGQHRRGGPCNGVGTHIDSGHLIPMFGGRRKTDAHGKSRRRSQL